MDPKAFLKLPDLPTPGRILKSVVEYSGCSNAASAVRLFSNEPGSIKSGHFLAGSSPFDHMLHAMNDQLFSFVVSLREIH